MSDTRTFGFYDEPEEGLFVSLPARLEKVPEGESEPCVYCNGEMNVVERGVVSADFYAVVNYHEDYVGASLGRVPVCKMCMHDMPFSDTRSDLL